MGLDIRAKAHHEELLGEDAEEYGDRYCLHGGSWADREGGAPEGWHVAEVLDETGCGYGYYFRWRQTLAATYLGVIIPDEGDWPEPSDPTDPLWLLLNYSDCEGVFGPPAVKRIAARLNALDDTLLEEWARALLSNWRRVFTAAAAEEDGCVEYA